jgi:hypothetical protein
MLANSGCKGGYERDCWRTGERRDSLGKEERQRHATRFTWSRRAPRIHLFHLSRLVQYLAASTNGWDDGRVQQLDASHVMA